MSTTTRTDLSGLELTINTPNHGFTYSGIDSSNNAMPSEHALKSSPRSDGTIRRQRNYNGLTLINDIHLCRYIDATLSKTSVKIQDDLRKVLGLDQHLPKSSFFSTFHSTQTLNREDWAARLSIKTRRSTWKLSVDFIQGTFVRVWTPDFSDNAPW